MLELSPGGLTVNSRERVLQAMSFVQPDRVAVDLGAHRSSGIQAIAYGPLRDYLGLPKRLPRLYDMPQQLGCPQRLARFLQHPFQVVQVAVGDGELVLPIVRIEEWFRHSAVPHQSSPSRG